MRRLRRDVTQADSSIPTRQQRHLSPSNIHPRTSQKLIFEQLCNEQCFVAAALDAKAKTTLKKRLQRGRKFLLLTRALGTGILRAVPEVSVTRLDAIRLEELSLLCLGSIEEAKIKVILGKMIGWEVCHNTA